MTFRSSRRKGLIWLLYANVLYALMTYGYLHGQMAGFALTGLGSGFCFTGNTSSLAVDGSAVLSLPNCPMCAGCGPSAALEGKGWYVPEQSASHVFSGLPVKTANPQLPKPWQPNTPRAPPGAV